MFKYRHTLKLNIMCKVRRLGYLYHMIIDAGRTEESLVPRIGKRSGIESTRVIRQLDLLLLQQNYMMIKSTYNVTPKG